MRLWWRLSSPQICGTKHAEVVRKGVLLHGIAGLDELFRFNSQFPYFHSLFLVVVAMQSPSQSARGGALGHRWKVQAALSWSIGKVVTGVGHLFWERPNCTAKPLTTGPCPCGVWSPVKCWKLGEELAAPKAFPWRAVEDGRCQIVGAEVLLVGCWESIWPSACNAQLQPESHLQWWSSEPNGSLSAGWVHALWFLTNSYGNQSSSWRFMCQVVAAFSGETPTFEDKDKLLAAAKPRWVLDHQPSLFGIVLSSGPVAGSANVIKIEMARSLGESTCVVSRKHHFKLFDARKLWLHLYSHYHPETLSKPMLVGCDFVYVRSQNLGIFCWFIMPGPWEKSWPSGSQGRPLMPLGFGRFGRFAMRQGDDRRDRRDDRRRSRSRDRRRDSRDRRRRWGEPKLGRQWGQNLVRDWPIAVWWFANWFIGSVGWLL